MTGTIADHFQLSSPAGSLLWGFFIIYSNGLEYIRARVSGRKKNRKIIPRGREVGPLLVPASLISWRILIEQTSPPETLNLALTADKGSTPFASTFGGATVIDGVGESAITCNNIVSFRRTAVAA